MKYLFAIALFISCASSKPIPVPPVPPEPIVTDTIHQHYYTKDTINVSGVISVTEFGALCDGVHDDILAWESARDYVIDHPAILTMPAGVTSVISRPLLLQKVVDGKNVYFTIHIRGLLPNKSASAAYCSTIQCLSRYGYGIGIQFGRSITIENITLLGEYMKPYSVSNYNIGTLKFADWIDPTITDNSTHPYAGICIDPTGNMQGGGGGTSDVTIKNCSIRQWMVGIALTPNTSTQNDEMINIVDDDIEFNRVGIAIGQDQSKTILISGLKVWGSAHTVLDGVHYGQGTGGGSVFCDNWNIAGNVNQLFNVKLDRFPLSASRIYSESLYRIGSVGSGAGANFNDCEIDFLMGDGIPAPGYLLFGTANFHGGCLRYYDNNSYHRMNFVGTTKAQAIKFSDMTLSTPPITIGLYGAESNFYPTPIFDNVRQYSSAKVMSIDNDTLINAPMSVSIVIDTVKWIATVSGSGFGSVAKVGDYILYGSDWSYFPDNPAPYPTVQIGRITSITGDNATLNDVGVNAFSATTSVVIDRLK